MQARIPFLAEDLCTGLLPTHGTRHSTPTPIRHQKCIQPGCRQPSVVRSIEKWHRGYEHHNWALGHGCSLRNTVLLVSRCHVILPFGTKHTSCSRPRFCLSSRSFSVSGLFDDSPVCTLILCLQLQVMYCLLFVETMLYDHHLKPVSIAKRSYRRGENIQDRRMDEHPFNYT